jgi:hypothetical protein
MNEIIKSFREELASFDIEMVYPFSVHNYGPFDYLNEINPLNKPDHERFMSKFKDGVYAIATAKNEPGISLFQLSAGKRTIAIPKSMKFLIGRGDAGWMVYIPKQYLNLLLKADKSASRNGGDGGRNKDMEAALKAHDAFYRRFFLKLHKASQKYLDEYFSNKNLRDMALNGSCKENVPEVVLSAISENKINPKVFSGLECSRKNNETL